jgi:hypothetical protein
MVYLCVLIYAIAFAGIAMTVAEGLWSNLLSLISLLICAPLAIFTGPQLGIWMQEQAEKPPEFGWYFVFGGVWLVFFFSIMIVRIFLDRACSRVRVKFVPPLERVAGPVVGLGVAAVFASFFAFTIYMIPVAAGEWKFGEAAPWQQSTLKNGSSLFFQLYKGWAGQAPGLGV